MNIDINTILSFLESFISSWGVLVVFISSFIEITPMGWTIPGGVILATAGFFAFGNTKLLLPTIISGSLGAWLTFILAYFIGHKTGNYLIKKLHQEKNAERAKKMLSRNGAVVLTTSMLANLTRFWIAYVAGQQKYPFFNFLVYSATASFAWVVIFVMTGYITGSTRGSIERTIQNLGAAAWFFVLLALAVIIYTIYKEIQEEKNENIKSQRIKT